MTKEQILGQLRGQIAWWSNTSHQHQVADAVSWIQALEAAIKVIDDVDETRAFDNGSGMTEVMTFDQAIAEIQRLGRRCEDLHALIVDKRT